MNYSIGLPELSGCVPIEENQDESGNDDEDAIEGGGDGDEDGNRDPDPRVKGTKKGLIVLRIVKRKTTQFLDTWSKKLILH